jgi:hypothetical protein
MTDIKKSINFRLTTSEIKILEGIMKRHKFTGSMSKFGKKLLLDGGEYRKGKRYLEVMSYFDLMLSKLDEVLELEPVLLRSGIVELKQNLLEKLEDNLEK